MRATLGTNHHARAPEFAARGRFAAWTKIEVRQINVNSFLLLSPINLAYPLCVIPKGGTR